MEQKVLNAAIRAETGKGAVGRLRKSGRIPAVVYGHEKTHTISIDGREFSQKFKTISENTIITLKTTEGDHDVLVKDYQENLVKRQILHIDFYEIESGKVLRTHVPVHITGNAPGVREGGVLETGLHELEIECLPINIPEVYKVDVSGLAIGMAIHVSDLTQLDGVRILNSQDQMVVTVSHARAEAAPAAEEEGEEAVVAAATDEKPAAKPGAGAPPKPAPGASE